MPTTSKGLFRWSFGGAAALEDFSDRLNHVWTFGLLILMGCIINWRHMFDPIRCWCPPEFSSSMQLYAESQCWNSYFIVHKRDIRKLNERREELLTIQLLPILRKDNISTLGNEKVDILSNAIETSTTFTFYQWLPVIYCLQALLFKLPHIIFYIFHGYSGISFDKISGLTAGYEHMNLAERSVLAKQVARYVHNWCKNMSCLPWRWLTGTWLIVKILYVVNVVKQLTHADRFLRISDSPQADSQSYGYVIIDNLFSNNATLWKSSPAFPRQAVCEMDIVRPQGVHNFLLQCNLPSNSFNEAAYTFIWVWLLLVTVVTCTSLGTWLLRTIIPVPRNRYIARMMELKADSPFYSGNDLARLSSAIGEDGVMVLKLIGANSSELFVADVLHNMMGMVAPKVESAENELADF